MPDMINFEQAYCSWLKVSILKSSVNVDIIICEIFYQLKYSLAHAICETRHLAYDFDANKALCLVLY